VGRGAVKVQVEGESMINDGLDSKTREKIIGVISVLIPTAKIYLYGSRAKGNYRKWSDIDIALDAGVKLRSADVGEARSMLTESNILYSINIIDLHGVSPEMREEVLREYTIWKK